MFFLKLERKEEARGSKRKLEDRGRLLESDSSKRKLEEARGSQRKLEDRGSKRREEGCLRAIAKRGS